MNAERQVFRHRACFDRFNAGPLEVCREAPDIDGVIYVERAGNARVGEFITVKALQGFTYDVLTERIEG